MKNALLILLTCICPSAFAQEEVKYIEVDVSSNFGWEVEYLEDECKSLVTAANTLLANAEVTNSKVVYGGVTRGGRRVNSNTLGYSSGICKLKQITGDCVGKSHEETHNE